MVEFNNEEGQTRNFMSQLKLDDSIWQQKAASVPLRKALFKAVNESNFLFYQDFLNNLVSWITLSLYIF